MLTEHYFLWKSHYSNEGWVWYVLCALWTALIEWTMIRTARLRDVVRFIHHLLRIKCLITLPTRSTVIHGPLKSEKNGLDLNIRQTKFMMINRTNSDPAELLVGNVENERVDRFLYLRTTLNSGWDHAEGIRSRLDITRSIFIRVQWSEFKHQDADSGILRFPDATIWNNSLDPDR